MVDLGSPLRIHYKEDDRMTIHSRTSQPDGSEDGDCTPLLRIPVTYRELTFRLDFYNYHQHGIDFLISGTTHTVKKIILHTNIVCHTDPDKMTKSHQLDSPGRHCSRDTNVVLGRLKAIRKMTKTVRASLRGSL